MTNKKRLQSVKKFRKNFNTRLITSKRSYSIQDIVQLFGISKNTVSRWIKQGLQTTDTQQPYLIWGQDLKDFIAVQNAQRKQPCQDNELFCCKCQKPTTSQGNRVRFKYYKNKLNMVGVCNICGSSTNRTISAGKIDFFKKIFVVEPDEQENLRLLKR